MPLQLDLALKVCRYSGTIAVTVLLNSAGCPLLRYCAASTTVATTNTAVVTAASTAVGTAAIAAASTTTCTSANTAATAAATTTTTTTTTTTYCFFYLYLYLCFYFYRYCYCGVVAVAVLTTSDAWQQWARFSCPFMERKLQGLKILADAVAASETTVSGSVSQGNSPALTPKVCLRLCARNGRGKKPLNSLASFCHLVLCVEDGVAP